MGFVSIATARFDAMSAFYLNTLQGTVLKSWDRSNARGMLLDLGGLRLELMDATRERNPPALREPDGRFHLVIEVTNIAERHQALPEGTPPPVAMSWGASALTLLDPDGLKVSFLQWDGTDNQI
jgi:catechol 2,3-dioxygenase-like lactoylglutathione lyase family enzyme